MKNVKKLLAVSAIFASLVLPFGASASIGPIATIGDLAVIQNQLNDIQAQINILENRIEGFQSFGDTINNSPALFETSLAAAMQSGDTSMTLLSGSLRDGTTLSGSYCFTIDSGLTTTEYVCGTASGTAVTALTRGIGSDGVTSYNSLKFSHRYGADVKITDFPQLQQQTRLLNGVGTFPNILQYASSSVSSSSFTQGWQIIDKAYADALAFAGAPNGSTSTKGIYQEANNANIASGTLVGTTGADLALTTRVVATSSQANSIPATNASGTLDASFASGTSPSFNNVTANSLTSANTTFTGTSTVNGTLLINGVQIASTSFSKFGGTGADGALNLTTGTVQTYNLGGASVVVKNFSSLTIAGTSTINFSNANSNGTIVIWKVQGNATLTSATTTMIDLTTVGSAGGTGGSASGGSGTCGSGGGGGASLYSNGNNGTTGTTNCGTGGNSGNTYGAWGFGSPTNGPQGGLTSASTPTAGVSLKLSTSSAKYYKALVLPGQGGGGGGGNGSGSGGNGGQGGGALYIEVNGCLNFTGTINANGLNGANSGNANNGGGGGAGGSVVILYNCLTANSGTINVSGGSGGGGGSSQSTIAGAGATGGFIVTQNTEF